MAERDLLEYLNTEDNQNPSNSQGRDLLSYTQESTETAPQEDLGVSTVGANLYDMILVNMIMVEYKYLN